MNAGLAARIQLQRGGLSLEVELDVDPGEVVALIGPNGAGKSTVLRVLSGLLAVDTGTVRLGDVVLDETEPHEVFVRPEARNVGVVFQDYLLFGHMNARENVAFGLRARGTRRIAARAVADRWLDRVGLADRAEAFPGELSGGQAQRVALARALAVEPSLLLLDEPLAALDAATRRDLRGELRRHLADFSGATVLVTHDAVDAYALADRVVVLDAGRVVQAGSIAEVTARPRSRFVAELVGTNLVLGRSSDGRVVGHDGSILVVAEAPEGEVCAVIAPQAVGLSLPTSGPAGRSARNAWRCTVAEVVRLGERARVSMVSSAGAPPLPGGSLTSEITLAALDELALRPGDEVVSTVKATEVGVYPV